MSKKFHFTVYQSFMSVLWKESWHLCPVLQTQIKRLSNEQNESKSQSRIHEIIDQK